MRLPGDPRRASCRSGVRRLGAGKCAGPGWAAGARSQGPPRPRSGKAKRTPRGGSSGTQKPRGESGACPGPPRRARGVAGAPSGLRASQQVRGGRGPAGRGRRAELGFPGLFPRAAQGCGCTSSRESVCARPGVPAPPHSPLALGYTFSQVFLFFSSFSLVAPGRSGSEESEGCVSYPPPVSLGYSGASACGTDPASERSPSSICDEPHQGSLELAWIPGFVSPAAAHTMPMQLAFDPASLVQGSGCRGRDYSTGMLPLDLLAPWWPSRGELLWLLAR